MEKTFLSLDSTVENGELTANCYYDDFASRPKKNEKPHFRDFLIDKKIVIIAS
jgi:hypothetical protein